MKEEGQREMERVRELREIERESGREEEKSK